MSGFIKLHRSMIEWEWYKDINVKTLFLHLIFAANYEAKRWQGIEVKRGQLITGRLELAESTGLSERKVRTALEKLKMTNEITIKTTNRFSIITLTNYALYQDDTRENGKQNDQQNDQQATNKRPTDDQQATTTKEIKEIKKERIINNPLPPKSEILSDKTTLPIPDFLKKEDWEAFLEIRKKKKAPLTNHAIKLIFKDLEGYENKKIGNGSLAIQNSIKNGWQGVFEPKQDLASPQTTSRPKQIHKDFEKQDYWGVNGGKLEGFIYE